MAITYQNLRIQSIVSFQHVHFFEFNRKAGCHGVATVKGIAYADTELTEIESALADSEIKIVEMDEEGDTVSSHLFCGVVTKALVTETNRVYTVEIQAKTGSVHLDRKRISRSFQDVTYSYVDVVQETVQNANGAIICSAGNEIKIKEPIFHYEETVWEFVQRMASHVSAPIIPACVEAKPQVYFGYPVKGNEIHFEDDFYTVKLDRRYYEQNQDFSNKSQYLYYVFDSLNLHDFGDYTFINKHKLQVCEIHGRLEDGILKFKYTMGFPRLITNKKYNNPKLSGVSLIGTVVKTYNEMVELHLDIDEQPGTTHPFKWTPVTGNLMYLMPEIGTRASLYFQSADETSALAMDSPRTNGKLSNEQVNLGDFEAANKTPVPNAAEKRIQNKVLRTGGAEPMDGGYEINIPEEIVLDEFGTPPMSDADNKQLHTNGQEMNLTPSQISFKSPGKEIYVDDSYGVIFFSNKKVTLQAQNTIRMKARKISIDASTNIVVVKQ